MAARLKQRHQDEIKDKIQTSQLVNRLNNHAFGEIELSSTQIDAIKFLLNKTLSNAPIDNNTNITGDLDFKTTLNVLGVKPNDTVS